MSRDIPSPGPRIWFVGQRRPLLGIAVLLGAAVLVAGLAGRIRYWTGKPVPPTHPATHLDPPTVGLHDADPSVVKVIAALRAAVSQSPSSGDAWGRLGMAFYAHNFSSKANTCFVRAEELDDREARWPYFQGLIQTTRDPDLAIQKLRRA